MQRTIVKAAFAVIAFAGLSACSSGGTSSCITSPFVPYPTPTMVSPANGATGVSPAISSIIVSSTQSRLYGALSLVAGSSTILLTTLPVSGGSSREFASTPATALSATTTYTLQYTITYPGSCSGPAQHTVSTVGTFTTSS